MSDNLKAIKEAKSSGASQLKLWKRVTDDEVAALAEVETLKRVDVREFEGDFGSLHGISNLFSVSMLGRDIGDFELLADVSSLRRLALEHYGPENLSGIGKLTQLEELSLSENEQYTDIEFLRNLVNLQALDLSDGQFFDLGPVSGLTRLRVLKLANCDEVTDIGPLAGLSSLTELDIRSVSVTDLGPLRGLVNLQTLRMSGDFVSIDPIRELRKFEVFEFGCCDSISDFTFLSAFDRLKELAVTWTQMADASPLAALKNLERLSLERSPVSDISPIADLVKIRFLNLRGTKVRDLTPLKNLDLSENLYLDRNVEYLNNPMPARLRNSR